MFPQLPPSVLLGHLKVMDSFIRAGGPDSHPGMWHRLILIVNFWVKADDTQISLSLL